MWEFQDYKPNNSFRDKPFLPDLHLKSALTDHYIKQIISIIEDPTKIHPNKSVNRDANLIISYITRRFPKLRDKWREDIQIIYGKDSVKYYKYFWEASRLRNLKQNTIFRLKNSWKKLKTYESFSKKLINAHLKDIFLDGDKEIINNYLLENYGIKNNVSSKNKLQKQRNLFMKLTESFTDETIDISNNISRKFNRCMIPDNLKSEFFLHERLNILKTQIIKSQVEKDDNLWDFNLYEGGDTTYNNRVVIHQVEEKKFLLLSSDQILLLSDTMTSRFHSLVNVSLYNQIYPYLLPSLEIVREVYDWMNEVLERFGNNGYNLLKQLEPICIGVFLDQYDPLKISKTFLQNIISDTEKIYLPLLDKLIQIISSCTNYNQIFEIYGLYRHGGHPIVDEIEGCRSMKEVSRCHTEIDGKILRECAGASKKSFIIEYIKKNRYWPNIDIELTYKQLIERKDKTYKDLITSFMDFLIKKPLNFNEFKTFYPLIIWSYVRFKKTLEYNDYEDFTILLSDTAISPSRDHWTQLYRQNSLINKCSVDYNYSRRVLINVLKRRDFSMKEIREAIQSRNVPENWTIVAVHSKERELKIKARLFAMMVLEMRMWFACTEKNIGEGVFPYVPTQTMTNSEAELTQKLLNLTHLNKENNTLPILISLDFDKFNQRWRKESTFLHFEMLDDLFGTPNHYTYSHEHFENSLICLASVDCPPDYLRKPNLPIKSTLEDREKYKKTKFEVDSLRLDNFEKECDTVWIGQGGGFEGLRQKGWTFCITGMLETLHEKTGFRSYIIGQGDNQFLVLLLPIRVDGITEEDYLNNYQSKIEKDLTLYMTQLEKTATGLGMKLKLSETWISTRLLNYGKEILIDGCFQSSILKRASRAYAEVNDVYPTLSKRISSIFSSFHSAASKSFDFIIPYHLSCILSAHMIDEEMRGRGLTNWDKDLIPPKWNQLINLISDPLFNLETFLIFFNLNKEIGGYPILPITEFMFRGHPDPISSYIATLPSYTNSLEKKKIIAYILREYPNKISSNSSLKKLIQDPTSWNWENGYIDTGGISDLLESYLKATVNNIEIKKLFSFDTTYPGDDIIDFLGESQPFVPRVCNEIYRHSPEGAKLGYLSIFSDMKTIRELMSPADGKKLIDKINYQENILISYVINMIEEIKNMEDLSKEEKNNWIHNFKISEEITNVMWDNDIKGSRIPHPAQQTVLVSASGEFCPFCSSEIESFKEMITYFFRSNAIDIKNQPLTKARPFSKFSDFRDKVFFKRGEYTPYIGSTTREKRSKSLINFPKGDRSLYAAQSLQRIRDWVVEEGSNLDEYILSLIQSRTDLPENLIRLSAGKYYGGSVIHRFHDVITKHSCRPNSRPNLFSHVYFSADETGDYSGGKENYNIHFQSCFLYGFSLLNIISFWDHDNIKGQYHLHFIGYSSINLSDIDKISNDRDPPKVKSMENSKILFTSISDYVDKCFEYEVTNELAMQVTDSYDIIRERAHISAATIIFHNLLDSCAPIIQTFNVKRDIDITKSPLTINDLGTLDLKYVMKKVGSLWYLYHLEDIIQFCLGHHIDLDTYIYERLSRLPSDSLRFLRNLIAHNSLRDKLISQFGWPTSVNFIIDATSFDKIFIESMYNGAIDMIYDPVILEEIFPHESLTLNRWVMLFLYSIANYNLNNKPFTLLKYIHKFTKVAYEVLNKDRKDLNGLLKKTLKLIGADTRFDMIDIKLPLISFSGCEPWIRLFKDKINPIEPILRKENRERVKSILKKSIKSYNQTEPLTQYLSKNLIQLGKDMVKRTVEDMPSRLCFTLNVNQVEESKSKLGAESPEIRSNFLHEPSVSIQRENRIRESHKFRLTGIYSTAHYKYSELTKYISNECFEYSINLAEGAGGVSKFISHFYDVKGIIYNSLLDLQGFFPQKAVSYTPPELIGTKYHKEGSIYGIKECLETKGDLTDLKTKNLFMKLIIGKVKNESIMTMDAELDPSSDIEKIKKLYSNTVILFNLLPKKSWLIIKTFYLRLSFLEKLTAGLLISFSKVILVKPQLSSSENTEIFLLIQKMNNNNIKLSFDYDINLQEIIHNSGLDYSTDLLINSLDLSSWHKGFKYLGFDYNLNHSLQVIFQSSLNINKFKKDPIKTICNLIDSTYAMIQERFYIIATDLDQETLSRSEREIKKSGLKESLELEKLGCILLNGYLLKDILLFQNFENLLPIPHLDLDLSECKDPEDKGQEIIYRITPDTQDWLNLYSRHFQRILGYLRTPNLWKEYCENSLF